MRRMVQMELFTEEDFKESAVEERKRYLVNSFRNLHHLRISSPQANWSLYQHLEWTKEELRKLDCYFHVQTGKPKCKECRYYECGPTPASGFKPVMHCRCGFSPHNDKNGCCVDDCTENLLRTGEI